MNPVTPVSLLRFALESDRKRELDAGPRLGQVQPCAAVPGEPQAMAPVKTLLKVAPGESATLVYEFDAGARFGLAAVPSADGREGDANAFLATVTIRER